MFDMEPDIYALIAAAAHALFDNRVAVAALDPREDFGRLLPAEEMAIAAASRKRRLEFAAGRLAARSAMLAGVGKAEAIPVLENRAPKWPLGIAGSIAHCDDACIAAVCETDTFSSIGIDIEPWVPLERDLTPLVTTPEEREWLSHLTRSERGLFAKLIFSAKEAAYKAQSAYTGALIGFEAISIEVLPALQQFRARFTAPVGMFAKGAVIEGRFVRSHGFLITGARLPSWPV